MLLTLDFPYKMFDYNWGYSSVFSNSHLNIGLSHSSLILIRCFHLCRLLAIQFWKSVWSSSPTSTSHIKVSPFQCQTKRTSTQWNDKKVKNDHRSSHINFSFTLLLLYWSNFILLIFMEQKIDKHYK